MNVGLRHVFIIHLFIIIKSVKLLQQHLTLPKGSNVNPTSRISLVLTSWDLHVEMICGSRVCVDL